MEEGQYGSRFISDTSNHIGRFCCIEAVADSVIDTIVGNTTNSGSQPLPKLGELCGVFTEIKLTSGKVIAYNAPGGDTFTLTVDASALVGGTEDAAYSQDIAVSGDTGTVTITKFSGTLPIGTTLTDNGDGTATLAGTPTVGSAGTYNFRVKAEDSNGGVGYTDVTIVIAAA